MRRLVCWILMAVMLLTALPAVANAEKTSGLFTYEIKGNGTVTVTDFDWQANGSNDIYIPNMLDGYTVTGIGNEAFLYDEDEVNANSVSMVLSNNITTIGEKAFWNSNLASINIPDGVRDIGYGAFVGFEGHITMSNTHPVFAVIDGNLYHKQRKELLYYRGTVFTEMGAVVGGIVPEGIKSIGDYACYGRYIVATGEKTEPPFWGVFPSTLTSIGDYAFYGSEFQPDTYVSHATAPFIIPEGVSVIGEYAFAWSTHWNAQIVLPSTLETLGNSAFFRLRKSSNRNDLEAYPLPYSIEVIFSPNTVLKSVPENCFSTGIDRQTASVDASQTQLESIGEYAFSGVRRIILPETISELGENCFQDAYSWNEAIIIPEKVKAIPEGAYQVADMQFHGNENEINLAQTEKIESLAFAGRVIADLYLPDTVKYIAIDAFDKRSTFVVEAGSYAELWCQENGFIYTVKGTEQNLDWLNN